MKKSKKIELKFNKLNVSSLQNIVGGKASLVDVGWYTDACNSNSQSCTSQNTKFTDIVSCCGACSPTNMKC